MACHIVVLTMHVLGHIASACLTVVAERKLTLSLSQKKVELLDGID